MAVFIKYVAVAKQHLPFGYWSTHIEPWCVATLHYLPPHDVDTSKTEITTNGLLTVIYRVTFKDKMHAEIFKSAFPAFAGAMQ